MNSIAIYFKTNIKQECFPVGCVLSVAVAISGDVCLGGVCLWVQGGVFTVGYTPSPVDRMTDRYKNITFQQLLMRMVNMAC